jgi:hypothetical protein
MHLLMCTKLTRLEIEMTETKRGGGHEWPEVMTEVAGARHERHPSAWRTPRPEEACSARAAGLLFLLLDSGDAIKGGGAP